MVRYYCDECGREIEKGYTLELHIGRAFSSLVCEECLPPSLLRQIQEDQQKEK